MRLVAEELNIGSYEILLTMPVTYSGVVAGKFMAALAFVVAMLIPTMAYPITVTAIGQLDWGPVVGGYIGAVLLGAAFCAIGLFASSLTRNQIIAFIIGMAICFILTLIDKMLFSCRDLCWGFCLMSEPIFTFKISQKALSTPVTYFTLSVLVLSGCTALTWH